MANRAFVRFLDSAGRPLAHQGENDEDPVRFAFTDSLSLFGAILLTMLAWAF